MTARVGKAVRTRTFAASVAVVVLALAAVVSAQTTSRQSKKTKSASAASKKTTPAAVTPAAEASEKQLAQLSRALRDHGSATTYAALAAFANQNAKKELGPRAALALGFYDLSREKPDLALGWLRKAVDDKLLREYVQYWQSQASLDLGQREEGLEQLQSFRRDFPDSALTEQALTSLAQVALSSGKADIALAALEAYPNSGAKPSLLLLRAQAKEKVAASKGEKPLAAAIDYLDLHYRFPLNEEAKAAGLRIPSLQFALGEEFPGTPVQTQIARAEAFFLAKRWREARAEYVALLPKLSGVDHERLELGIAQCDVQSGGRPEILSAVQLTDPDLDAERMFAMSQAHRSHKIETQMLDDVEQLAKRFPQSNWVEEGLFAVGNYYWANLDREHAVAYYRRALEGFPTGRYAQTGAWRVAWTAYLDRSPEAADLLEDYIRRFPTSSYIPDALYWLGRSYERAGHLENARSFYVTAAARFPLTYFGAKAAERVRPAPQGIGVSPLTTAEFLSIIPAASPLPPAGQPLPAKVMERQTRARALSDIAFDASAELEYRAAYNESRSPQFLIAAAGAAVAAGHYAAGMVAVRQAIPQLEARQISEIPDEAWRAAFPLPYESNVRIEAARNQLDPMLVAGLIRQESAFESHAMSHAGAVGLMQVMPKTALKLARQMRVRYARARLTDPGYNLQLGSRYLAGLIQSLGTPEAALAAYNAGEDRVAQWTSGQNYMETAEFVESIPFTETREYVQIVIRNAQVYRQVYGGMTVADQGSASLAATVPSRTADPRPLRAEDRR